MRNPIVSSRLQRSGIAALLILALFACASPSKTNIEATLSGDPERIARAVLEDQLERQGIPTDIEGLPELVTAVTGILSTSNAEVRTPAERHTDIHKEGHAVKRGTPSTGT
ncbi:hypothetical protein [Congregibacter sp.]|uniref:hypothetical protein n=1 Tax=Congregibacter sp. TaxID=2744308 RepID=UPI003F6D19C6